MLSLLKKKPKRLKRVRAGSGLKVRLAQVVEEQVARGVPRQRIYDELIDKSRAVLSDPGTDTPHADANVYLSVADQVLHVMIERNRQAEACERTGRVREATLLYEQNVADAFDGVRPYERLYQIYNRQRRYADAARICRAYLALPERSVNPLRAQIREEFHSRLIALEALLDESR